MDSFWREWQSEDHELCGGSYPALFAGYDVTRFQLNACWLGSQGLAPSYKHVHTKPDIDVITGPIEDYTDQPVDHSTSAPAAPGQTTVEQAIDNELDKPENEQLRDWLNYELGSPGQIDPTGIGAPNPDIEFEKYVTKWIDHGDEFETPYVDRAEYWRDAAEIVERAEQGDEGYLKCQRSDGATIYWDGDKRAIVIVRDGKIETYLPPLPPETAFDYFVNECSR